MLIDELVEMEKLMDDINEIEKLKNKINHAIKDLNSIIALYLRVQPLPGFVRPLERVRNNLEEE